jgi:hypothetical protein
MFCYNFDILRLKTTFKTRRLLSYCRSHWLRVEELDSGVFFAWAYGLISPCRFFLLFSDNEREHGRYAAVRWLCGLALGGIVDHALCVPGMVFRAKFGTNISICNELAKLRR